MPGAKTIAVRHAGETTISGEDAVYEIGSLTKPFTARLLALLADDGIVALDDPVIEGRPFTRTGLDTPGLLQGHTFFGKPTPPWNLAALAGAGGLRSTASDMLRFLAAEAERPSLA